MALAIYLPTLSKVPPTNLETEEAYRFTATSEFVPLTVRAMPQTFYLKLSQRQQATITAYHQTTTRSKVSRLTGQIVPRIQSNVFRT
jgi:chromosome segregation and condensation protein ScpB